MWREGRRGRKNAFAFSRALTRLKTSSTLLTVAPSKQWRTATIDPPLWRLLDAADHSTAITTAAR
jgi:hypothetical protein